MGDSMKTVVFALFVVGAALAIPTPDDIAPETSFTQLQQDAIKEAKKTVASMLEAGSDSSACADLADEILNEVKNAVSQKEEVLGRMDDGSTCDSQFAGTLRAAQDAVAAATTAKNDADTAAATAAAAPVDFGTYALDTLGGLETGECSNFASDPNYIAARGAETTARTTAETAAATLVAAQAAVEAAQRQQNDAIKVCKCHVYSLYKDAYDAANQVSEEDMRAWSKGKHMQCVLAGTAPTDCEVGTPPEVSTRTLAPGVDGSGCDDRWVNEPGCYVRTPNGCNHADWSGKNPHDPHYISHDWHHDWWGEHNRNAKADETACTVQRKHEFDAWCTITDTEMRWVPPSGGFVGQEEREGSVRIEGYEANPTYKDVHPHGRLLFLHNGQWGTVCDDNFDTNNNGAMVACRQMGFAHGEHLERDNTFTDEGRAEGTHQYPIWIDQADGAGMCSGSESRLDQCPGPCAGGTPAADGYCTQPMTSCSHSEDVEVRCWN